MLPLLNAIKTDSDEHIRKVNSFPEKPAFETAYLSLKDDTV